MSRTVLAAAALMLPVQGNAAPAVVRSLPEATTIIYETGACFGACPVYRVTVRKDGRMIFTGIRYTRVIGRRSAQIPRRYFLRFRTWLDAIRPPGLLELNGPPLCKEMATDQGSVNVVWQTNSATSAIDAYFGCDMQKNTALFKRLADAPKLLPLGSLVGRQ